MAHSKTSDIQARQGALGEEASSPSGGMSRRKMEARHEAMLVGVKPSLDASEALRVAKKLKMLNALDEAVFDGHTALTLACKFNDEELIKALLAEGASALSTTGSGRSPIMEVIESLAPMLGSCRNDRSRWRGCVEALVAAGADINHQDPSGKQAIHRAVNLHQTEQLEWLLANGANPSAADHEGLTPLLMTARTGQTDFVRILISAGADVFAKCSPGGGAEPRDAVGMAKSWGVLFEDAELLALLVGAQEAFREKADLSAATPAGRSGAGTRRI